VPAHERNTVIDQDIQSAPHYVAQYGKVDAFLWEAGYGEGSDGGSAHRPNVVDRVQRGNASVIVRVIDNGSEEINGLNQRQVLADQVDSGIVGRFDADQKPWVGGLFQATQYLGKLARREFSRSTRAGNHFC
jgi:hypothetical protein